MKALMQQLTAKGLVATAHEINEGSFAAACYEIPTDDLIKDLDAQADQRDLDEFGITAEEWRTAIRQALESHMSEWADE